MGLKVLSLFDGMSCGQIALNRIGLKPDIYLASEIDKHAIKVTQYNYPDTVQLGDVTKIKNIPFKIDLLIGGSPCQGFSFAGKQLNFNDPRSSLFFEYVRLLKELKPTWFLLENVKMKKEYEDVISKYTGVYPLLINSSTVCAQSRERLYWTNIPSISWLKNSGKRVKDILLSNYSDKFLLKNSKSLKLNKDSGLGFKKGVDRNSVFRYLFMTKKLDLSDYDVPKLLLSITGDTPSKLSRQTDRVYSAFGKSPCLTAFRNDIKIADSNDFNTCRILSPVECERLQTVPDNYTSIETDRNRYKMLGNGWTVDVIAHIFRGLLDHVAT